MGPSEAVGYAAVAGGLVCYQTTSKRAGTTDSLVAGWANLLPSPTTALAIFLVPTLRVGTHVPTLSVKS
jgi:hypothetical protein